MNQINAKFYSTLFQFSHSYFNYLDLLAVNEFNDIWYKLSSSFKDANSVKILNL